MNKRLGIIGYGTMGSAIAGQLKQDYRISVFDTDASKMNAAAGVERAADIRALVAASDIVLLAVKPQDFDDVLRQMRSYPNIADRLLISIAAGITIAYIEAAFGVARVVRAMPNMPAKIGEGITALSRGRFATDEDVDRADDLFSYLGEVLVIDERLMDAATAVSGSGPAYLCYFAEARALDVLQLPEEIKRTFVEELRRAAVGLGFSERQAELLVGHTVSGTISFLKKTGLSASELRAQVTSKGGTTEAAIGVLTRGGALEEGVRAAVQRAHELSKGV